MTKIYGFLAYACGSIAIATLVLGIMVGGGRQAWANECGCGVQPPGTFGDPAYDTWYNCMMTCGAGGGGGGGVGIACWPNRSTVPESCSQGYCGFFTTCRNNVIYDDYGYGNCCM